MAGLDQARILLVDDEAAIRTTYTIILEQHGYSVTTAGSPAEAREAIAGGRFDLLICDLALGEAENGLDVMSAAREREPSLPCVLLTGYPDTELPPGVSQNGVQVLFKPIEVPTILSTIDFLLRLRK